MRAALSAFSAARLMPQGPSRYLSIPAYVSSKLSSAFAIVHLGALSIPSAAARANAGLNEKLDHVGHVSYATALVGELVIIKHNLSLSA